jgi:hypothetical protein
LFFVLSCAGAFAQANSSVTGIVTDQTGAAVSGANISLTDPATGATKTTVSSGTGLYEIAGLNAANYNMKVLAKGFEAFAQNGIVVNISATFRVDIKLTVGAESQTVTVEADALAVQNDSNVVSTLINQEQITELPTNGRNIVGLATLGLGVTNNLPDSNQPTSVGSSFNISFNGLSWAHNIWLIDGGEAYDRGSGGKSSMMPSQDALGEFQMLTSNYPPDYGISSGGTISMSLKSGTAKLHGEAWEFARNDDFDAHNYFDTNQQTGAVSAKPELRYNVYGFNAGGPVIIPHIYGSSSKQKTFFFVNEEWRREVTGTPPSPINAIDPADDITSIPTGGLAYKIPGYAAAGQTSIFVPNIPNNAAYNQLLAADNLTPGSPFPGNVIPANLIDPNAVLFNSTGAIPKATNSTADTATVPGKQPTKVREDVVRIDHNINDKWSLFGHFIDDQVSQVYSTTAWGGGGDSYPTVGTNFVNPSYSTLVKLTGSITPTVLLEATFNYNGNKIGFTPNGITSWPSADPLTANSFFPTNANATANHLPNISLSTVGTGWGMGSYGPWKNGAEDYAEIFNLSVTKGQHAFKFGGGYNRYIKNQQTNETSTQGTYTFADSASSQGSAASATAVGTGDSYVDFLLGLATSYSQGSAEPIFHYVNQTTSVYAQDNWHVSSRLSVQYGVRYDAIPHTLERYNQISNFDPAAYQAGLAPTFDPSGTGALSTTSSGLQTFAPIVAGSPSGANSSYPTGPHASYAAGTYYMNGIVVAGVNTARGLVKNDYATIMPRLGFTLDLTGKGKTILRGGFGTFYERIQGNDMYDTAGGAPFVNTPSANTVTFSNPNTSWFNGSTASTPLFPQNPTSISTTYPAPETAQYSLGVQHEIAPAIIWTTQYVGNLSRHQNLQMDINNFGLGTPLATRQAWVGGGINASGANQLANYPGFSVGGITNIFNSATGSYNALQTGVRQQNRHGLSFEVDYTYAHEQDTQASGQDVTGTVSNPWNLKYDAGPGVLDRRHVLSINYEYKLPFFAHEKGLIHSIAGGWEISGTAISETGMPWAGTRWGGGSNNPSSGYSDTVGLGGGYTNRPNMTGKVVYPKKRDGNNVYQLVSNSAFSEPTPSWLGGPNLGFGNAPKDAVVGPGRTNFSTALYKSFAFGERAHLELRADTFNTFNHTQFDQFNFQINSANFGEANNTQDPREIEFGGKFVF